MTTESLHAIYRIATLNQDRWVNGLNYLYEHWDALSFISQQEAGIRRRLKAGQFSGIA